MSNLDPFPLSGIIINPNGQEPVLNIFDSHGNAAPAFTDAFGVNAITFPMTLEAQVTVYLGGEGPWTVSCKVNGVELAGQVVLLDDTQIGTVTLPASLTAAQTAGLQTDPQQITSNYNISGSMATYTVTANANSKTLTLGAGHDFQVGHGIRVYGGSSSGDTTVPPTPTIGQGGTPGSTSYQYQIAACAASAMLDIMSPASVAGTTTTGATTLNSTNYNKISWAPGSVEQGYAVYGRTAGSQQLLGTIWFKGPVHFNATLVTSGNAPPFIGGNLAVSTQYTYQITGVDFMGNETPPLTADTGVQSPTATTGSPVTGIALSWDLLNGSMHPYRYYNVYRQTGGAGAFGFMQQIQPFDLIYNDYGLVAPNNSQNPPTTLTFVDNGQTALTGAPGRPPHIPVTPPSATIHNSLFTSVTAVTPATVTLAAGLSATVTNTTVAHDDAVAIHNALVALGTVTLPNGYYPIGQVLNVPLGCTLQGLAPPNPLPVTVTTTTNPLPNPNAATLCFNAFRGNNQLNLVSGCGAYNLQLFWPYQSNGAVNSIQSEIPYPCSIHCSFAAIPHRIDSIADCNSWVGIEMWNDQGIVKNVWNGAHRFEVMSQGAECVYDTFKSDPGYCYSANVNQPQAADRTVIRGVTNGNLASISNIWVDGAIAVWWTTGNVNAGGNGSIGVHITNAWCDDFSPALVLDAPASDTWNSGGQIFFHHIANFNTIPGGGGYTITTGLTNLGSGANEAYVYFANCRMGAGTITGQVRIQGSGSDFARFNVNATSPWVTTPWCNIALAGCAIGDTVRFNVTGGHLKAEMAACYERIGNNWIGDTTSGGGVLYVVDEQGMKTERFTIPTGTVLSTGDNTVGHLVVAQTGSAGTNLYVITATGSGTSATDVWKLNGTSLFTTAALVSSLRVGGMGEGVNAHISGVTTLPLLSPVMTLTPGSGTSFVVYPVVLNVAAGLTTSAPLELELTYCLTPLAI